ncbi:MAG: hypothetical protein ACLTUE_09740 [Oscillospiraceae bacterium]
MKVRRFFLRLLPRLGIFVLSVLLLSVLTFYISRLAPGDPLVSYYGDRVEKMSPAEREWAEDKLGLNDPLPTQYARWFSRALHGDFGISYKYKIDVLELIGDRIGNTLLLGGLGFVLLFVLALLLGALCAWKEDRPLDRILCKLGTVTALATPCCSAGSASCCCSCWLCCSARCAHGRRTGRSTASSASLAR